MSVYSTTLNTAMNCESFMTPYFSLPLSLSLSCAGHGIEPGGQDKSLTEEELIGVN